MKAISALRIFRIFCAHLRAIGMGDYLCDSRIHRLILPVLSKISKIQERCLDGKLTLAVVIDTQEKLGDYMNTIIQLEAEAFAREIRPVSLVTGR